MKTSFLIVHRAMFILAFLFCTVQQNHAQLSAIERFVTQECYDEPVPRVMHRIELNSDGSFTAARPIGVGSLFTLWVHPIIYDPVERVYKQSNEPVALDWVERPSLFMFGQMNVISNDTTYNNPQYYPSSLGRYFRTREDQPFLMNVNNVVGVRPDDQYEFRRYLVITMVKRVRQASLPYNYLPGQEIPANGETIHLQVERNSAIASNTVNWASLNLACGEYEVSLNRLGVPAGVALDDGDLPLANPIPPMRLAEATVRVWPRTIVNLVGITAGQKFTDRLPRIDLALENLYPDSRTFVRVFKAGEEPTEDNIVNALNFPCGPYYLDAADVNPGDLEYEQPQPRTGSYDHLSDHANESGDWVMQVVTQTPFSRQGEVLLEVPFILERIKTRGQISTAEVTEP